MMKKMERKNNKKRKAASLANILRSKEADEESKKAIENDDNSNCEKKFDPVRHFRVKIYCDLTPFDLFLER